MLNYVKVQDYPCSDSKMAAPISDPMQTEAGDAQVNQLPPSNLQEELVLPPLAPGPQTEYTATASVRSTNQPNVSSFVLTLSSLEAQLQHSLLRLLQAACLERLHQLGASTAPVRSRLQYQPRPLHMVHLQEDI